MKFDIAVPIRETPAKFDPGPQVYINLSRVCHAHRITGEVVELVFSNHRLNMKVFWKWEDVAL